MKKIDTAFKLKDVVFAADACVPRTSSAFRIFFFLMELENIVANTVLLKAREGKLTHKGAKCKQ